MPEYKAVDKLFYSFHSEFEAIVMDMIAEKTDIYNSILSVSSALI